MGTVWELDFYSRPIVDERGKKLWEVLIVEGAQGVNSPHKDLFQYSKFLSNTEVNSIQLQAAIEEAIAQAPAPPSRIRFFRYAMQAMIERACNALNIAAKPSRRTLALQQLLEQRQAAVYPQEPGYQPSTNPVVSAPPPAPKALPDALVGQQWAFVTLTAQDFADMPEWEIDFGEAFPLEMVGVSPDQRIPGVIIFSPRALPLAGWMSGLELAYLNASPAPQPAQLLLETGTTESWILANLNTPKAQTEAQNFEQAKQAANQVHFVAVQSSPEAESFAGFWLLQERLFG
ncbi:Tab2/Atab2 family RNA-binding protein [Sphaerothrix gracilis]|uniref:Tab2/Atab2 family RNA-binding protein n=1 Tax=Sphaerothrix gracilis TaxID=3151835 RepID=UPI0031FD8B37